MPTGRTRNRFASNATELSQLLSGPSGRFDGSTSSHNTGGSRSRTYPVQAGVASINALLCPHSTGPSGEGQSRRNRSAPQELAEDSEERDQESADAAAEQEPPDESFFSPYQLGRGVETFCEGASLRSYAEQRKARESNWKTRLPASQQAMVSSAALVHDQRRRTAELLLEVAESSLSHAAACHACHALLGQAAPASPSHRQVMLVTLGSVQALMVPTYHCSTCSAEWEAAPESIGCFPSAPVRGQYWIDVQLLQLFHELTTGPSGCSATAFVASLNTINSFQQATASKLDDRLFLEAYQHYRHAARHLDDASALGASGLDAGAFGHCPGCAVVPTQPPPSCITGSLTGSEGPGTSASAEVPPAISGPLPVLIGAQADACTKASRFGHAGSTFNDIRPEFGEFVVASTPQLRRFVDEYKQLHCSGSTERGSSSNGTACSTAIHCAQEKSSSTGMLDIHGIVGFACSDGVPGRGLFLPQHTHEQFGYYVMGLNQLKKQRQLQLFAFDSSCKFSPHLQANVPRLADGVRFVTGYLHGSSHVISCQLAFHAATATGFGRIIGEDVEHIWSAMKLPSKNMRYLAAPHWHDAMDDLLHAITSRKAALFAQNLVKGLKAAQKRKGDLEATVSKWEAIADEHGWDLSIQPSADPAPVADLSTAAQYVAVSIELEGLELLDSGGHMFALAAPATQLSPAATELRKRQRLQAKATSLLAELGPEEAWQPSSNSYQHAAEELRQAKISQAHSIIQQEVSELSAIRRMQESSGMASADTRRLRDRALKHQRTIRDQLHLLQTWEKFLQPSPASLPAYDVQKIYQGDLPWLPQCVSGNASCTYAKHRYFFAKEELQRCNEHAQVAAAKANNARAYYLHRISSLEAAQRGCADEIERQQQLIRATGPTSSCTAGPILQYEVGRQHVLTHMLSAARLSQQLSCETFAAAGL